MENASKPGPFGKGVRLCGTLLANRVLKVVDEALGKRANAPLGSNRWPLEFDDGLDLDRSADNEDFICRAQLRAHGSNSCEVGLHRQGGAGIAREIDAAWPHTTWHPTATATLRCVSRE